MMASNDNLTLKKDWQNIFIRALSKTPNVTAAASAAGINRQYVYQARENDPVFAAAWDDAIGQGIDRAEGELYRRAVRGVTRKIYYQDRHIDTVKEYSDTLLIFLLKSHKPDVYSPPIRQEHTGAKGGAIETRSQVSIYIPDNGRG